MKLRTFLSASTKVLVTYGHRWLQEISANGEIEQQVFLAVLAALEMP